MADLLGKPPADSESDEEDTGKEVKESKWHAIVRERLSEISSTQLRSSKHTIVMGPAFS